MSLILPQRGRLVVAGAPSITLSQTAAATSGSDTTTYSFNTLSVGPAETGRIVVLAVSIRKNGTSGTPTATIDGNAMTEAVGINATSSSASYSALFTYQLDSGTTADFAVTWSGGRRCGVVVYSMLGASSETPLVTATGTELSSDGASIACNLGSTTGITAGNVMIANRITDTGSAMSQQSWSGSVSASGVTTSITSVGTNPAWTPVNLSGQEDIDQTLESTTGGNSDEAQVAAIWG